MSESEIQLPSDGSGKQIRTQLGDGTTSLIPNGVHEEVVALSDGQGLLPGDARQRTSNVEVRNDTLLLIVSELRQIKWLLADAFDAESGGIQGLPEED